MKLKNLSKFIGQESVIKSLKIGIKASQSVGKSMDHILLYGPPGVGKTSLAIALSYELKSDIKIIQSANIEKVPDLMGIMTSLKPGNILFIDEIHTIKREVAEILYPALENKVIDLIIGKNLNKRTIRIPLPDFTLVAATTNLGDVAKPLEERFGYVFYLDAYSNKDMCEIIQARATEMQMQLSHEEIEKVVNSSRGIPRNAIRILKRIKDYFLAQENISIEEIVKECGFTYKGLNALEIKYLIALKERCQSLTSISHKINIDKKTIINKVEPYMYSNGWIIKNSKGRALTEKGKQITKELVGQST